MLSMSHRIKAASSSFPLKFHAHRCPVAKIPSDDTVRRDIDRRFEDEKEYVRDMLQDAPGRRDAQRIEMGQSAPRIFRC